MAASPTGAVRMVSIADWLNDLGLRQYAAAFARADIDEAVLADLTDEDLQSLGITLGHRKRLLKAIAGLSELSPTEPRGQVLPTTSEQPPDLNPQGAAEAERRQLSVLFCDLVGSTALSARLDAEDLREVMQAYYACCADIVGKFAGSVAHYQGDGILMRFGYPRAHEDDAERAVRCGLEMAAAIARLVSRPGITLQARIGIASGSVVVGDRVPGTMEQNTTGDAPNLAARLQTLAQPGQVVIDALTHQLAAGVFAYVDLGRHELKGFAEPIAAWRVSGVREDPLRFAARHLGHLPEMVGRQHELGLLLHRWQEAESGEGRVVILSGEAGIGKSRLVRALLERLPSQTHTPTWQCSPYHTNTALFPALDQLIRAADITEDDPPVAKLEKLEQVVGSGETVALYAELLGIPTCNRYAETHLTPAERKKRLVDAMLAQLKRAAEQRAVCFVVEDVHWIDPTSLDLLDLGVELIQDLPVLLVATLRPELEMPWRRRGHVTTLTVSRLNRNESARVAQQLIGGPELSGEVLDRIVDRAVGIPLFVEELTRSALESGLIEQTAGGAALRRGADAAAVPSSLQGSLVERLDRLSGVKEIAQVASVIGRDITIELLAAVVGTGAATIQRILDTLVAADIMHRRSTGAVTSYAFRHSLLQDAAYSSLLRANRRRLHARVADMLETRFAERCQSEPEVLAQHLSEAGDIMRAGSYWLKAAQQAMERSANREAVAHTGKALDLLATASPSPERDRLERALQSMRLRPATAVFGFSSDIVESIYQRLRELLKEGDDPNGLYMSLDGEFLIRLTRAQISQASSVSETMVHVTSSFDDRRLYHHSLRNRALAAFFAGDLASMRRDIDYLDGLRYDLSANKQTDFSELSAFAIMNSYKALLLWCTGYPVQAETAAETSLHTARNAGPNIRLIILVLGSLLQALRLDTDGLARWSAELMQLATEQELPWYLNSGRAFRAMLSIMSGDSEAGAEELHAAMSDLERNRTYVLSPLFLTWLAAARDPDTGLKLLGEAARIAEQTGDAIFAAIVQHARGRLFLKQDRTSEAEASFSTALNIARSQGMTMFALRSAVEVAELLRIQGRVIEATAVLTPIRAEFTEGFDTVDLQRAVALEAALRSG